MKKIGVLYGGMSGEHAVSLCSAAAVISNLDSTKYDIIPIGIDRDGTWHVQKNINIIEDEEFGTIVELKQTGNWLVNHFQSNNKLILFDKVSGKEVDIDIVFPVVHGTFCEDGTLQGLLELAMVPYVGADVLGSSIAMDKDVAKRLFKEAGIPVVPWITVTKEQWSLDKEKVVSESDSHFDYPIFIKPCNMGSSVGVKKVDSLDELEEAIDFAFQFDIKIIIEQGITAREIECAVLGNGNPKASILGEINPNAGFYSYEAKYLDSNGAKLEIPANIDETLKTEFQEMAIKGYQAIACSGMARVDFFLDKNSSNIYLNEINTLPGFTSISMYPKLWEASGLLYSKLLDELIGFALERHEQKLLIKREM